MQEPHALASAGARTRTISADRQGLAAIRKPALRGHPPGLGWLGRIGGLFLATGILPAMGATFETPQRLGHWTFPPAETDSAPVRLAAREAPADSPGLLVSATNRSARLVSPTLTGRPSNTPFSEGAVRMLFRPNWASDRGFTRPGMVRGRGPGTPARLFQLGQWTDAATRPCLALMFDPAGTNLLVMSQDGRGRTLTNFAIPFLSQLPQALPGTRSSAPRWYEIAVNFSPQRTEMILDGAIQKDARTGAYMGPGAPPIPLAADAPPLAFGSDLQGENCAESWIDEIELFSAPISFLETQAYRSRTALSAHLDPDAPSVTLDWWQVTPTPLEIKRRAAGETNWSVLASAFQGRTFVDRDAQLRAGMTYEYDVGGRVAVVPLAGAPQEQRGHVLVLVDETLQRRLREALETYVQDLAGDGWTVSVKTCPRHDDNVWNQARALSRYREDLARTKELVVAEQRAASGRLAAVVLVGHVLIPYSGTGAEDGHADHRGAWPADNYYGDLDAEWTDSIVNTGTQGFSPTLRNVPGDGKFDPGIFAHHILPERPEEQQGIEVAVGRIDFSNLPAFAPRSEVELLQDYFAKNHRYRHKQLEFAPGVVAGGFFHSIFNVNGNIIYENALYTASRLFPTGADAARFGDAFGSQASCLWSMQGGYGSPLALHVSRQSNEILGVDVYSSEYLARQGRQLRIGFHLLKGSYFGDWNHYRDNFMRACLALPDSGLAAVWTMDTLWRLEETAAGAPLGTACVRTARGRHSVRTTSLLGDPTLRLQITAPPTGFEAQPEGEGVRLAWAASPEPGARYHVYRSLNGLEGPSQRLTEQPLTETTYRDPTPPRGRKLYQVRALAPVITGSGSFTNLSQGVFVESR